MMKTTPTIWACYDCATISAHAGERQHCVACDCDTHHFDATDRICPDCYEVRSQEATDDDVCNHDGCGYGAAYEPDDCDNYKRALEMGYYDEH